jgi:Na+(H+)/acetate symporter ActP
MEMKILGFISGIVSLIAYYLLITDLYRSLISAFPSEKNEISVKKIITITFLIIALFLAVSAFFYDLSLHLPLS